MRPTHRTHHVMVTSLRPLILSLGLGLAMAGTVLAQAPLPDAPKAEPVQPLSTNAPMGERISPPELIEPTASRKIEDAPAARQSTPVEPSDATISQTTPAQSTASPEKETGMASWYGPGFHGRRTASGSRFDMHAISVAHPKLPLLSYVKVTLTQTGQFIIAQITDRGPYSKGRIVDLSKAAAQALGFIPMGVAHVTVEPLE
jgi:rare lipoprotein A